MKVVILGASGETGQSIINGLLQSRETFVITALVRLGSINKPEVQRLVDRGVKAAPLDLEAATHEELVNALVGQDTVISCVIPFSAHPQIRLADAAKAAGVKRFVPSAFGTPCPPYGVMLLREIKQDVVNHIQKIYLPYTVIDVGWWYQSSLPRLESGKIDYALKFPVNQIIGDGNLPSALTDLRDVGKYVARIIIDPRTLNKSVFVHNEIWTQEKTFSLLGSLSGEVIPRSYTTENEMVSAMESACARYHKEPSVPNLLGAAFIQYSNSIWLRGDNLPQSAQYLGYLDGKELYPTMEYVSFDNYVKEVLAGQAKAVYANRIFGFEEKQGGHKDTV